MEIRKIENFARFGYLSKGVVYILIGSLTTMAALGIGDHSADKQETFRFILQAPFGKIILGILAFGLLCFSAWRFAQVMEGPSKNAIYKDVLKRIKHIVSGFIYASLSFYASSLVVLGDKNKPYTKEFFIAELLEKPKGEWIVLIIAFGIIVTGFNQLYKAISGVFIKGIKRRGFGKKVKLLFLRAGQFGYTSRGIVLSIIGYLILLAALHSNPNEIRGTQAAFDFLQSATESSLLLGIISIGLIGYGIFMFVKARYGKLHFH